MATKDLVEIVNNILQSNLDEEKYNVIIVRVREAILLEDYETKQKYLLRFLPYLH